MVKKKIKNDNVRTVLKTNKITTLSELKGALGTSSTMTVFRKLKELGYLSSYSHRGKYYTLFEIADFDEFGLWSYQTVWFSKYGNLVETSREFIDNSRAGFIVRELESILHVEVKHTLLKLFQEKRIHRERLSGVYVYFSSDKDRQRSQILLRQDMELEFDIGLTCEIAALSHELKAAIILFFSLLDERQRRLYAGLESFKLGHGGDKKIAQLFGLDVHTVAKGRREVFDGDIDTKRLRKKGAGRKPIEKKRLKSSKK